MQLPISMGISPEREFSLRSILRACWSSPMEGGIGPENVFPLRRRICKEVKLERENDKVPDSKLFWSSTKLSCGKKFFRRIRTLSWFEAQSSSGMVPVSLFEDKSSSCSCWFLPRFSGIMPVQKLEILQAVELKWDFPRMVPSNSQLEISIDLRLLIFSILISPVKLLPSRWSSASLSRPAISGETEPYSPIPDRIIETTRPWEHLIPLQEQTELGFEVFQDSKPRFDEERAYLKVSLEGFEEETKGFMRLCGNGFSTKGKKSWGNLRNLKFALI
nr:hypothetical protein EUGRSUZ_I02766 [Ipomoea batatas]